MKEQKGLSGELRFQQGQDIIEFALALPLLLLLICGIMDFGIVIFSYNSIANAAREGARYAVTRPLANDPAIEAATRQFTIGLNSSDLSVDIDHLASNAVKVDVTYDLSLVTGFVIDAVGGEPNLRIHSATTMKME